MLPVLVAASVLHMSEAQAAMTATAAFLGHCYPVYLGFKGGKGVATALGIYLVLSPLAVLGALLIFAALLWKWRFVSLGSVTAAAATPILVLLVEKSMPLFLATLFISAMVVLRHRVNIERLLNGTESRFKA
jgi:glycerol-3-phosphate acyltransferase PlsY